MVQGFCFSTEAGDFKAVTYAIYFITLMALWTTLWQHISISHAFLLVTL
jgi:hypothetical protein